MGRDGFRVDHFWVPGQHPRARQHRGGTRDGEEQTLALSVKRYTPLEQIRTIAPLTSVTLFAAGGNGFPKEMYEPLVFETAQRLGDRGIRTRAIWSIDMAHQGASGIANAEHLGDEPSWFDYSSDILHVINHLRDEITGRLIGVGHSVGATAMIHLSILHPNLFSELISYEAIIGEFGREAALFALYASRKVDRWPSLDAAREYFRSTAPYRAWDERVIERWIAHGIQRSDNPLRSSGGEVRLSTPRHQEAITYGRLVCGDVQQSFACPDASAVMSLLPSLLTPLVCISGSRSTLLTSSKRAAIIKSASSGQGGGGGRLRGRVVETVVHGAGHLLTFEAVNECADLASSYIVERTATSAAEKLVPPRAYNQDTHEMSEQWKASVQRHSDTSTTARKREPRL